MTRNEKYKGRRLKTQARTNFEQENPEKEFRKQTKSNNQNRNELLKETAKDYLELK
jgi:hypothetical protein